MKMKILIRREEWKSHVKRLGQSQRTATYVNTSIRQTCPTHGSHAEASEDSYECRSTKRSKNCLKHEVYTLTHTH